MKIIAIISDRTQSSNYCVEIFYDGQLRYSIDVDEVKMAKKKKKLNKQNQKEEEKIVAK